MTLVFTVAAQIVAGLILLVTLAFLIPTPEWVRS